MKQKFTYTIPLYENDWASDKIIKNVKVEISFSEKGWVKFTDIFY
jgi:hypothetical protein